MYDRFTKLSSKNKSAVISIVSALLWLIFGSSVSVLSPSSSDLGFLFGLLSALAVLLGPLFYIKIKKITVKNAKPLLVEPSPWLMVPLSFFATGVFCLFCLVVVVIVSVASIDVIDDETFLSNAIMSFLLLFGVFAPVCAYSAYALTHYKRTIQYGTREWKEAQARQKAQKR